jgi:hypothetical protein
MLKAKLHPGTSLDNSESAEAAKVSMTRRRVYIIGAGASVGYGLPTMKTLTWELCRNLSESDRTTFLDAVYESCGVTLTRPEESPDFEELLNRLDPRALLYLEDTDRGGPDASRKRAAALALSGLRAFIRERCLAVAAQRGAYDRLVQSLLDDSIVTSFNWDVLLEQAFIRAHRSFAYLPSKRLEGRPLLLKPHGSINWFALLDRELLALSADSNLEALGDDLSHYLLYLTEPLAAIRFGSCSPFVEASLSSVPAIVPPTASKLLSVGGHPRDGFIEAGHLRAMKAVWSALRIALDQANDLVVIGYSLPGSDAASIALLKYFAAGSRNDSERRVFLVEPNAAVAQRYRSLLKLEARVVCSDFMEFDPSQIP